MVFRFANWDFLFLVVSCSFWNCFFIFRDDKMTIKKGDKITIEYVGTLDDGTIFDQSEDHDELLTSVIGA